MSKWHKLQNLMAPVNAKLYSGKINLEDYFEIEDEMIRLAGYNDDVEYCNEIDRHWDSEVPEIRKLLN